MASSTIIANRPLDQISKQDLCEALAQHSILVGQLTAENTRLRNRTMELEEDKKLLSSIIAKNELKIAELEESNKILKNRLAEVEKELADMKTELRDVKRYNERHEALLYLKECNVLANKAFQKAYRIKFGKGKWDGVPYLENFMGDKPDDQDELEFWNEFTSEHKGTNNSQFFELYCRINRERNYTAHPSVINISRTEFDRFMRIVFPSISQQLLDAYREWSFSFPA